MADRGLVAAVEPLQGEVSALVEEWVALADETAASPLLHPGFILAWRTAFGAPGGPGRGAQLVLATARRDGRLAAALPLVRGRGMLVSPANWHTPASGPIARDAEAEEALAAGMASVRARRLRLLFLDRTTTDLLGEPARRAGFRVVEDTMMRSPYVEIAGEWEAFEATLKKRARSDLRRLRRRLAERGEVALESVRDGERVPTLLRELMEVEQRGWKGQSGTAIAQGAATQRFYEELARWAAPRGWLRLDALRVGASTIAVSFALCGNRAFYGMKIGYDPLLANLGPGRILLDDLVRRAFDERLERFEMLGDDTPYKREWCNQTRERIALRAFAPTAAGRASWLAYRYGRSLLGRLRDLRDPRRRD
jgi:CelD/BcsL family acetyltransferase involved in cellulose biosynthesis